MNKKAIISALKELGRIAVLGALAALITYIVKMFGEVPSEPVWLGLLVFLRLVDKYIHKIGMVQENTSLIRGLARF